MTPAPVRRHVVLAGHRGGLLARGEEVLSRGDYLVTPVATLEGLDALPALPAADLVVLDEGFGPEGGVRAAQHLRSIPRWRATSIMVVVPSGSTHLEECLVSGINDFLLAPFPDGELLDKVRRLTEVAVRREVNTMLRVHEVRAEGMTVHGKTLNVSVNGLLAEVDGELNVGRVVDVEFFLPDDPDSVREPWTGGPAGLRGLVVPPRLRAPFPRALRAGPRPDRALRGFPRTRLRGRDVIIIRERRNGATVLRIQGVVKLGESARQFSEFLSKVLEEDEGPVLLDFEKIDTLDSTGLGELIGYLQRFEERDRRMAIVKPRDRVVALLKLTRLDTLIRIFPDDQAALAYLAG